MEKRNIIVIGASAGGFEALKRLVADLPAQLNVAIFIVWHMAPDVKGILPQILDKYKKLPAAYAVDKEVIQTGRIYIAPPDHHLMIEKGRVRITKGPKENRFRPAVDPLFRSAAYTYGSQVIGVILSGALDDGSAGLWTVKSRGGLAVVQDPNDAEVPSMPQNALQKVAVDHQVPVSEMAALLSTLCQQEMALNGKNSLDDNGLVKLEIDIALQDIALEKGVLNIGTFSPFTCPECHGVLSMIKEGDHMRFRCHTGHAFSTDTLLANITESIEDSLWSAIRSIEENIILLNHLGDHFAEVNQPKMAALYFKKANDAGEQARLVRQAVLSHEHLSLENLRQQAEKTGEQDI